MQAVAFIKGVLSVYDLGCRWMFTCGQQAYADFAQISNNNVERRRIQDATVQYGRSCRRVRDRFEVHFFLRCINSDRTRVSARSGSCGVADEWLSRAAVELNWCREQALD